MLRLFVALLTLLSLALAQNTLVGRASVVDGDTLEIQKFPKTAKRGF
jgi:endonuclease YncB( thermonuclease family)